MPTKTKATDSLTKLLDSSGRPTYAVDAERRIVYCNAALASWFGLEISQIVGREVEYHSEPQADRTDENVSGPLASLCPPPRALAGEASRGTVSCVVRDGRLIHRQAEFIPLAATGEHGSSRRRESSDKPTGGVLVLLAPIDMSSQELASEIAGEPTADELHRAIRRFRRAQAAQYSAASLLGVSSTVRKIRAQAAAAVASGANVLIIGPEGSGRAHVARLIHYRAAADANLNLLPIDCGLVNEDLLRRTLDSLRGPPVDTRHRATLLLENIDRLATTHRAQILDAMRSSAIAARWIATFSESPDGTHAAGIEIDSALLAAISTITIRLPRLIERLEDLPILAQSFLEACNQGNARQVGSVRPEALDLLALYSWPGELDELRHVIAAAHRVAKTHEITPHDLPAVIHHAKSAAAATPRREAEHIVLDELLAAIEKEVIERALAQANGNKTEAAALLGMTRPRLYRRLVQIGLASETTVEPDAQQPEFVERDDSEQDT